MGQKSDFLKGLLGKWVSIRCIWGSSIFLMVGGGDRMFESVILTMITDITDHSQRQASSP